MTISRSKKKAGRNYPVSQFEIQSIESLLKDGAEGNSTLIYDDKFSIVWIQERGGEIQVDLQKLTLQNETVYYVKPGQALLLDITENAKGYVISFAREFVELYEMKSSELFNTPLFHPSASTPVITIKSEVASFMASIADEMLQEYRSYLDLRAEILKGFLKIFIIYLSRQAQTTDTTNFWSRKTDLVNLFFTHLEKHFTAKKMVKEYAGMLAVTPSYLNDTVKEISGYTASHHIQQRIVLEAKRRAVFEGYSLKEAAYDLGFFDPSHFSKYFKNSSGINFTDFRKGVSNLC